MSATTRIATALVIVLIASAAPSEARIITNIFRGTVTEGYWTLPHNVDVVLDPNDTWSLFDGGRLVGKQFTLTERLDTARAVVMGHGSDNEIDGARSADPRCNLNRNDPACTLANPFDVTLTIQGWQRTLNAAASLVVSDWPYYVAWTLAASDCVVDGDICFQVGVPLAIRDRTVLDLDAPLPAMAAADFDHDNVFFRADRHSTDDNHWYMLSIESINASVPEPPGLALIALGLVVAVRRHRQDLRHRRGDSVPLAILSQNSRPTALLRTSPNSSARGTT